MGMVRVTPEKAKTLKALMDWSRKRDSYGFGFGTDAAEKILIYNDWSLTKAMAYVCNHDYDPVPDDITFIKGLYNEIAKLQMRVDHLESYLMDRDGFEDSKDEEDGYLGPNSARELNKVLNGDDDS